MRPPAGADAPAGPSTAAPRAPEERPPDPEDSFASAGAAEPAESGTPADVQHPAPRRRLSLGDPVARTAAEDRPESWGEAGDSDAARLAFYRAQRPPHHGS